MLFFRDVFKIYLKAESQRDKKGEVELSTSIRAHVFAIFSNGKKFAK